LLFGFDEIRLLFMKRIDLTPKEKASLEVQHSESTDVRESDRIKAVLLRSEGWTVPMIAQALRRHETTITRHLNDYREGKLTPCNGGSQSDLSDAQTEALISHLVENTYHHVYEIIAYVTTTWSISYSIPGMNKWLHRNGFSYKKPKGTPHKADKEEQLSFIERYEKLKSSIALDEHILFMDGVHPSQATKITYGWIRTGKEKRIETTASRTRVNVLGAIELGNLSQAVTEKYDTINSESIASFFEVVRSQYNSSGTIHMILDGAGYNRSEATAKAAIKYNIELHPLPPYSPNLNPIERLWKVMNEKVRNNRFFKNAKEFRQAIETFFKNILPDIGQDLNDRINDNFQIL
jgi:transposase